MKKVTILGGVAILLLVMIIALSGCFNTQSTLAYDFYSQSTPASVLHVYISIISIRADEINNTTTFPTPRKIDLVSNDVQKIVPNIGVTAPLSISHLKFVVNPVATVVYATSNASITKTFNISNTTVDFYGYSTQQMEKSSFKINGVGQNKSALIVWDLSNFSSPSTTNITLKGMAFDEDGLIKLSVKYKAPFDKVYFAKISDVPNTFEFSKKCDEDNYDRLNDEYKFILYPFRSPASTYQANLSINTATQTLVSTEISIGSSDITITLP